MNDTTEDGRRLHVYHQSDLADVDLCAERGRRRIQDGLQSQPTDSTINGTAVHAAIEHALFEKRDRKVPLMLELEGVYQRELTELYEQDFRWTKYKDLADLRMAGHKALKGWLTEVEPQVRPLHIEPTLRRVIVDDEHRQIIMEGSPDCIDIENVIWDWKTGTRQYREWEYQRQAIQPTVYTYLHSYDCQLPWRFRYAILRPNGKVDYCNVTRGPTDHRWLKQKVTNLAIAVEARLDAWPVNDQGWWCSEKWCPAWDTCKGAV